MFKSILPLTAYRLPLTAVTLTLLANTAYAERCDYRPTRLVGEVLGKGAVATAAGVGTLGAAGKAAGTYTLVHATSGLTMLGSTMAARSAAGTVGIVAGSGGTVGAAGAIVLNPAVWIPALVVGVGGGGFEAYCTYVVDERITEYDDVLALMREFARKADPAYFALVEGSATPFIKVSDETGQSKTYRVEKLYVADGMLMHRDWFRNTTIGRVKIDPDIDPEATD